jgi:hypothetical protein
LFGLGLVLAAFALHALLALVFLAAASLFFLTLDAGCALRIRR